MFGQASASNTVRAAAAIAASTTINVTVPRLGWPDATGYILVFTMTGRTAGSFTAVVQGSFDGTTFFDLPSSVASLVQAANGIRYIDLSDAGPIPVRLRVQITTTAGFDGVVGIVTRGDGPSA